jgi:hypothetical protein
MSTIPVQQSGQTAERPQKEMKKSVWFSRHPATPEQLAEIASMGFPPPVDASALSAVSIETADDINRVVDGLVAISPDGDCGIFGVFAAPIQGVIATLPRTGNRQCFSAWNVTRTVVGGKPTFTHKQWVFVGCL